MAPRSHRVMLMTKYRMKATLPVTLELTIEGDTLEEALAVAKKGIPQDVEEILNSDDTEPESFLLHTVKAYDPSIHSINEVP